jgi:hypothetical protein
MKQDILEILENYLHFIFNHLSMIPKLSWPNMPILQVCIEGNQNLTVDLLSMQLLNYQIWNHENLKQSW